MYARFFRWASDRVDENGIVAFVTNRSFIESRTYDGFRKTVAKEFSDIYILDLGGDVRVDPRLSGTKHNVFGIQTGVAISFMVKKATAKESNIQYARRPQFETAEDKLAFMASSNVSSLQFDHVAPDSKSYWINIVHTDFESLMPTASKETKSATNPARESAIFKLYTLGIVTNRDDWMYDFDRANLHRKVKYLIKTYNANVDRLGGRGSKTDVSAELDAAIKWTRAVKRDLARGTRYRFHDQKVIVSNYRPFVKKFLYRDDNLNEMPNQTPMVFGSGNIPNYAITVMGDSTGKPYTCFAIDKIPDLNFVSPASGGTQILPLYRLDSNGEKIENITNWALDQFRAQYEKGARAKFVVSKDAIFHYVYAILHDPAYREKYAMNLKREFPRIPFYPDFWKWANWGEKLMALHIRYEEVEPWPLHRVDTPDEKSRSAGIAPKCMLKADRENGNIQIDSETQLTGIPLAAWTYRLGNRSPAEWVLDQYKEKAPRDPSIREKFNTYHFANHKENVIDLLKRLTRVSVETIAIINEMGTARR
jgi:predicted helicase